ncbi:MAG: hypothetical protein NC113_05950 [Bacteroides sp.]|nr:hypothetical protein [Bacteroides sp.]MCM1447750.1 hypothetical protein [Bacteroides sp.]
MNNDLNFEYYVFWGFIEDEHVLIKETSNYAKDKKNVLFWIGDEEGCIPSDIVFQRFNWVFKVHLRNENSIQRINGVNVYRKGLYHFPLLTIDDVPELEVLPFNKRKHDVYFCGNLNKNRFPLFYSLKEKKTMKEVLVNFLLRYNIRGGVRLFRHWFEGKTFDLSDKNTHIQFYSGFNQGADYKTYARFLQNSRIVLSPCGFHSTECFRFYEALRQGCIVITEPLPNVECYKDAPCITINSWKELPSILSDQERLNNFTPQTIRSFYDERLSITGIAKYVFNIIN